MNSNIPPSRTHDEDLPSETQPDELDYQPLVLDQGETWGERWQFNLEQEDKAAEIRSHLQFGGRLNVKEHFLPRALDVCKAHNLALVRIEEFRAAVDFGQGLYSVSAFVTLKRAAPPS